MLLCRFSVWHRGHDRTFGGDKVFPKPLQSKGGTPRLPTDTTLPLSLGRFYSKLKVVLYFCLLSQHGPNIKLAVAILSESRIWTFWTLSTMLTLSFLQASGSSQTREWIADVSPYGCATHFATCRESSFVDEKFIASSWSLKSIFWIHHQKDRHTPRK